MCLLARDLFPLAVVFVYYRGLKHGPGIRERTRTERGKNNMKKIYAGLTICALCFFVPHGTEADMLSQYTTHATLAAHTYVPRAGQTVITAIGAESDLTTSVVTLQARTGAGKSVTVAATNGANTIFFTNPATVVASNDVVIVYHDTTGTMDYLTVTNATTTNVIFSGTISEAATTSDKVYEMSTQGMYDLGNASLELSGHALFASPKDSPVRAAVTGTSASFLSTTAVLTP